MRTRAERIKGVNADAVDLANGKPEPALGELLRPHRRAAGLTQPELADAAGAGVAAVRDLEAFGVPAERIPAGLEAQAGLYRSLIADRRMLVAGGGPRADLPVRAAAARARGGRRPGGPPRLSLMAGAASGPGPARREPSNVSFLLLLRAARNAWTGSAVPVNGAYTDLSRFVKFGRCV